MSDSFNEAVERGIGVLDGARGSNWVHQVDLSELNMSDWCTCVIGQIYDAYAIGVFKLMETTEWRGTHTSFGIRHGFEVETEIGLYRTLSDYNELTRAWQARIELLRTERPQSPTDT